MISALRARSFPAVSQYEISANMERVTRDFRRALVASAGCLLQLVVDADAKALEDVDFEFIQTAVFIHHSNKSGGPPTENGLLCFFSVQPVIQTEVCSQFEIIAKFIPWGPSVSGN